MIHTSDAAISWKPNVIRFLTAQTVSLFGTSLVQYSIVWYVTLTTASGIMLTISTLCGFVPQILVSLFAGALIDRYDRKKLIMISDGLIAFATLLLALTFLAGNDKISFLFAALVVRSLGTGLQTPAVNAIIPQLVPEESLMRVNGVQSTLSSLILFLSPAVSGAIFSVAPLGTVLFIDVITAVIGICITLTVRIKPLEKKAAPVQSHLRELTEGFAYIRKNAYIWRLFVFQFSVFFLISPSAFLTPLLVSRTFGTEVWRLTVGEMTYSLGMIAGGILISLWGGFKKRLNTSLLACFVFGTLMVSMGLAPTFLLYMIFNTIVGIASPCYNAPITVSIQERVEQAFHGRVFSLMHIATACALPFGMAFFGPLADFFRVQHLLIVCGGVIGLISLFTAVRKLFD